MNDLIKKIDSFQYILDQLRNEVNSQTKTASFAKTESTNELESLKNLINSPNWPQAIDPDLLCNDNNHTEKMERAEGIRDIFINYKMQNMKVLDFGCAEGHLTKAICDKNSSFVVGFDCYLNNQVELEKDKGLYTHDWNIVKQNGPYDVVVLYDVIDHLENMTVEECFDKIYDVLNDDGLVFLRIHPFISRHGGHAYNKINKAYIHLFLTENELKYFYPNIKNYPTIKTIYPVIHIRKILQKTKFVEKTFTMIDHPIEDFFKNPEISSRIKNNMGLQTFPIPQANIQFVDIVLQKPKINQETNQ